MTTPAASEPRSISLAAVLDLKAAGPLRGELLGARGAAVEVDASGVQRLGGLCVQVLLSAQQTWTSEGQRLAIVRPSPDFLDGARLLGATTLTSDL